MPLQPGQVLQGKYSIVQVLGQGGFGAVYRAWDTNLERSVAVKENLYDSEDAQRQFRKEALFLSGLSHDNLPRVLDYFILPGQGQYLVMEFVEGLDLAEMLSQSQAPLPSERVFDWIAQICDALIYLHTREKPLIHRDIKPGNIRITPTGRAMLVDFGIAKAYDSGISTTVGARAVTPGFSPPEQYGQGRTDAQSDIYALGATLYALLTGRVPTESVNILVDRALAPPPIHLVNPMIQPEVSRVVETAMQVDKTQRWQSAAEFKTALLGASKGLSEEVAHPLAEAKAWEPTVRVSPPSETIRPVFSRAWVLPLAGILSFFTLAFLLYKFIAPTPQSSPTFTAPQAPTVVRETKRVPTPTRQAAGLVITATSSKVIPPTSTIPAGPTGTIAFHSDRGGNFDIYIIRADGSGLRQMTNSPSVDTYASWSADGRFLAFQSNDDGDFEIYLMDVRSRDVFQLTDNACHDYAPTFSPVDNLIAYYSACVGNREIFTIQLDGSQQRQLTHTESAYSWYPFWSSDGEWIYFSSNRAGKYWIHRMDPDGQNLTRLVRGCSGVPSPVGGKLVYQEYCDDQSSLFISSADGSDDELILDGSEFDYRDPYWSPDGNWLVYRSNRNETYDLFMLNLLSGDWHPLTEGPGDDHGPTWTRIEW